MCINQRIYQAGIARANGLEKRVSGRLTGGDIVDGTLTGARLRQNLVITAAVANPDPPGPSRTEVATPRGQSCERVTFTPGQAAINRRIAIASVVRLNEVLDQLDSGLNGWHLADGTITKADFAPGVTPSTDRPVGSDRARAVPSQRIVAVVLRAMHPSQRTPRPRPGGHECSARPG